MLEDEQAARFAANYERQGDGSLKMIDNPAQSSYGKRSFFSGGGGLLSTAPDYFRFTSMLQNMGELDGVRMRVLMRGVAAPLAGRRRVAA